MARGSIRVKRQDINKKKNGDNMSLYQTGGDLKTSAPNFKVCCLKNKQLKWR